LKLTRYAMVRVRGNQLPFDKLMRRLDGTGQVVAVVKPANPDEVDELAEDAASSIHLFSENLSSLINVAKDINTVTFEQSVGKGVTKEQVNYKY